MFCVSTNYTPATGQLGALPPHREERGGQTLLSPRWECRPGGARCCFDNPFLCRLAELHLISAKAACLRFALPSSHPASPLPFSFSVISRFRFVPVKQRRWKNIAERGGGVFAAPGLTENQQKVGRARVSSTQARVADSGPLIVVNFE